MAPSRSRSGRSRDPRGRQDDDEDSNTADLNKAKRFFQAKNYTTASKYLMRTIWYCECNHDSLQNVLQNASSKSEALAVDPVNPCFCKAFLAQLRQSKRETTSPGGKGPVLTAKFGPDTAQNMTNLDIEAFRQTLAQPCYCGSGQKACASAQHMSALDSLVVLHKEQKQPRLALEYAFRMINLAPTNARGYLRVGQILQTDFMSAVAVESGVRDALRCVYKHGVENVNESEQATEYRQLERQNSRLARMDVVGSLPPELAAHIIDRLVTIDLIRCRNVSKGWRKLLDSDAKFWTWLELNHQFKQPRRLFRDLLQTWGRGKVEKVVIPVGSSFKFNQSMMSTLYGYSGSLRQLEIHEIDSKGLLQQVIDLPKSAFKNSFKNLTRFEITQGHGQGHDWYNPILEGASTSLEHINLSGIHVNSFKELPQLNHVRSLKLVAGGNRNWAINGDQLFGRVPNVEHLHVSHTDAIASITGHSVSVLPSLVSVVLRESFGYIDYPTIQRLLSPNLRCLDVLSQRGGIFSRWLDAQWQFKPELKLQLEQFRCCETIDVSDLRRFLDSSVKSGSLRSLGLPDIIDEDMPGLIDEPIGAETVTTLGMSHFFFSTRGSYNGTTTGKPFLDLVAKYPKVTTIAAYPAPVDDQQEVILGLVNMAADAEAGRPVPRIRKIYQNCIRGVMRDMVMVRAKEVGVEIVHTEQDYMPPVFPWPEK